MFKIKLGVVVFALFLQAAYFVAAGCKDAPCDQVGIYAGAFAGAGRTGNRIVDIDGFADWGNPG